MAWAIPLFPLEEVPQGLERAQPVRNDLQDGQHGNGQDCAKHHHIQNDMTELTRNDLDSHDWATRAAEGLAQAKKLPPGLKRSEAIRKAAQLRIAADMKNWLTAKEPAA